MPIQNGRTVIIWRKSATVKQTFTMFLHRYKKESDSENRSQNQLGCSDYLFSNRFAEDLERLWELRKWIPDPCNPNVEVDEKTEGKE